MAYYPDLSPYDYSTRSHPSDYSSGWHPNVFNVGWLDGIHEYPKGQVDPKLVEKLKKLACHPVELYRGKHVCELCPKEVTSVSVEEGDPRYEKSRRSSSKTRLFCPEECYSNGEIRIALRSFFNPDDSKPDQSPGATLATESSLLLVKKVTYAAPVLIPHYIEAHGYLPPAEFLKALEGIPE
jgi:hypothetical protein